jgi:hypothetical protein
MRMQDEKPTLDRAASSVENDSTLRFICLESEDTSHLKALSETVFPDVQSLFHTSLEEALAAPGNNVIIVPIETPIQSLARRLKSKQDYTNALQDWFEETETFLQSYRKVRRRVRVMAKTVLLSGAAESWQAVAAHVGLQQSPAAATELAETVPCALSHLLSQYLIRITPKAQTLAQEIEAMISGPGPSFENSPELVSLLLKERQTAENEQVEQQDTTTQNDLLKESLSALLRENEMQSIRQRTLEKEVQLMSQLEAKLSWSARELLTAQEKAATLERRVAELSGNIDALYASNSWKITAPIRKISLLLRRR